MPQVLRFEVEFGDNALNMSPRNRDYHKKLYRLVRVLNKLETEGKVSPRDLADEFNVTIRTAQRDIELINMAEFPLISMTKGVYSFVPGFSLRRLPLSDEEASLLAFLCEVARTMGGSFAKSFKSLLSKAVLSTKGESPFHAIAPVIAKEECPELPTIRDAIGECRKIEIEYASGKRHRLSPLKIIHSEGFWYLVGQLEGWKESTTFRLDKINSVSILEEAFRPPKKLLKSLEQRTSIWSGPKRDVTVVLKVGADAASYFESATFFPGQRTLKTLADGSMLIETRVSHFMEVIPVVLRWIPHIHVVQPLRLRREIAKAVRSYLRGFP